MFLSFEYLRRMSKDRNVIQLALAWRSVYWYIRVKLQVYVLRNRCRDVCICVIWQQWLRSVFRLSVKFTLCLHSKAAHYLGGELVATSSEQHPHGYVIWVSFPRLPSEDFNNMHQSVSIPSPRLPVFAKRNYKNPLCFGQDLENVGEPYYLRMQEVVSPSASLRWVWWCQLWLPRIPLCLISIFEAKKKKKSKKSY